MARFNNTYEIVLRDALERQAASILPINEGAQATPTNRTIKNFDLMLWRDPGPHWLVEIKGRKLSRAATPNAWVTIEDLSSLDAWRRYFGEGFEPVIAFVFELGMESDLASRPPQASVLESEPDENWSGDSLDIDHAAPWFGDDVSPPHAVDYYSSDRSMASDPMTLLAGSKVSAINDPRLPHFYAHRRAWQAWVVSLDDFQANARTRSQKWKTLMLSTATFRRLAKPMLSYA